MKKVIISQETKKKMLQDYKSGLSLDKVGKKYGYSRYIVTNALKSVDQNSIRKDNHKYIADYRKFEKIDSNEKAYWLGFIAADGCVYTREKNATVLINISQKDLQHLQKFKNFMNSNVNIKCYTTSAGFSNDTDMCQIRFNSKQMAQDLIDKGVTQRKSLTLKPPKIEQKYFLPFILGYFDGDGSIFKLNNSNNYGIDIVGTKQLLEWINNILNISNKLEKRNEDQKNNYYIRCGGTNRPYLIMKQLYQSCPQINLTRKYLIYKDLQNYLK